MLSIYCVRTFQWLSFLFRAWRGISLLFSIMFQIFSRLFTLQTSACVRPARVAMSLITIRAVLVPPSDCGPSFTLSEFFGLKKRAGSYVKCFHQSGGCTFYYILCTYIYLIHCIPLYYIHYILRIHGCYTKGWFIAPATSQQGSQPLAPAVCKLSRNRRLWLGNSQHTAGDRIRRRDNPANCIIVAVTLHDHMYRIFGGTLREDTCIKFNGRYLTPVLSSLMGT